MATSISLPARHLNQLFERISQQYPRLTSLNIHIRGPFDRRVVLVTKNQSHTITRLSISIARGHDVDFSDHLRSLIERISLLSELMLHIESPDASIMSLFNRASLGPSSYRRKICKKGCSIDHAREHLKGLTKLEVTSAGSNNIEGLLELMQYSPSLISIRLKGPGLYGDSLESILKCSSLKHLSLQSLSITDPDIKNLAQSHPFQLESFAAGEMISEEMFISIISANPTITELNLGLSPQLCTDRVFVAIAEKLPHLRSIMLGCKKNKETPFTDKGFLPLIQGCTYLQKLYLGNPASLTPAALIELAKCPQLEVLPYV